MKRICCILICIILMLTLSMTACATNVDEIKPSGQTMIIISPTDYPVHIENPIAPTGGQFIVVSPTPTSTPTPTPTLTPTPTPTPVPTHNAIELPAEDMTLMEQIFWLINSEREKEGLNDLNYNFDLQSAADLRAKECAQLFSHTRPNGKYCDSVVEEFDYYITGENLIKADKPIATAAVLVDTWMNSPSHHANIVLPEFTSTAIGIYEENNVIYVAQIFMGGNA